MLPISDHNPTRSTPFVNYALLVANVCAFLFQSWLTLEGGQAWVVPGYGLVASRFMADPGGEAFTIFTSMFMHAGWLHLLPNMAFLHVFGDNVEDAFGHVRYFFFYLACGVGAGLMQVLTGTASTTPMVGASGAIAGVLGAYMLLYPRALVTLINPIPLLWLFFGLFVVLPAWVVAGLWFLWNLVSGVGALGSGAGGGVAFWAHIGGFVTGLALVRGLGVGPPERPAAFRGWRSPRRAEGYHR